MSIEELKKNNDHHPFFAPSAWPALELCAFYKSSNKESKDSEMGQNFHKQVESYLEDGLDMDDDIKWVGDRLNDDLSDYLAMITDDDVHSEYKMDIPDPETGEIVSWGTADVVLPEGLCVDIKAGYKYKDYRKQLLAYALGMFQEFECTRVTGKAYFVKLRKEEKFHWTKQDAAQEYKEFMEDLKQRRENREHTPNPMCMYCANKGKCPAQRELAVSLISEIDQIQWKDPSEMQLENPADRKLLGQLLYAVKAVSDREDELKQKAKEAKDKGFDIPGINVSQKAGSRKITDPQKAFELSQVPANDFIKTCKCTLGKLEKAYSKHQNITQKEGKKKLAEKLSSIIEQGESSIVVKRIL